MRKKGTVGTYLVEGDAQHVADDGFAGKQTVARLFKIVGIRRVVHILCDLIDARQRVENAQVATCFRQHLPAQNVDILHALILHEIRETLTLHARHVENVGLGDHLLIKIFVFHKMNAMLAAILLVFVRHGQFGGSDEVECGVEMAHGHDERVHGTSVFEVADQVNVQVVECALRLHHGVEVEQRLRRVLVCSVAGIDHRYRREFTRIERRSFEIVAHHDHIAVVCHHHNRVFEGFALCRRRHFGVGKSDDARPESVRGRLKRKACARAGLEKQGGDNAPVEELAVGTQFKFVRHLHEIQDFLAREVRDTHQAAVCDHESLCFEIALCPQNYAFLRANCCFGRTKISSFPFAAVSREAPVRAPPPMFARFGAFCLTEKADRGGFRSAASRRFSAVHTAGVLPFGARSTFRAPLLKSRACPPRNTPSEPCTRSTKVCRHPPGLCFRQCGSAGGDSPFFPLQLIAA